MKNTSQSFSQKLSKIFEAVEAEKLAKFLNEQGFKYENGKYFFQKELEKIQNIHQSYGIEVSLIEGKFRITFYSEDHMQDVATPILAENQDQAIEIVRNLLEKFLDTKSTGIKSTQIASNGETVK